ncbi:UNVERIFIED_CONTAM: hypothetical protein RF653_18520 [Kocuria sp. CPCC 205316]|uniref:hypothetical protein n=1 Tax=Kocuria TaxID=57493 RepID=UPI0036DC30CB
MTRTAGPTRAGADVPHRALMLLLRVLIAAALVVTAVIHLQLAPGYQQGPHEGIGQGTLFRLQAVASLAAALYVLVRGTRPAYLIAALTALSALAAVLITRYVPLPAIGPLPAMYEPVWYPAKTLTAVAEALAAALACVGYLLLSRARAHPEHKDVSPEHRSIP